MERTPSLVVVINLYVNRGQIIGQHMAAQPHQDLHKSTHVLAISWRLCEKQKKKGVDHPANF